MNISILRRFLLHVLIGFVAVLPALLLLVTLKEWVLSKPAEGLTGNVQMALLLGLISCWTSYILVISFFYRSKYIPSALRGMGLLFGLSLGYAVSSTIVFVLLDFIPNFWDTMLFGAVAQILGGVIMGYYLGQSKARFGGDAIAAWKVRSRGLLINALLSSAIYFLLQIWDHPNANLAASILVLMSVLGVGQLGYRALRQHSRLEGRKRRANSREEMQEAHMFTNLSTA